MTDDPPRWLVVCLGIVIAWVLGVQLIFEWARYFVSRLRA